jgi:hypothetical protein
VINSDCPLDKACLDQRCSDPCSNVCGNDASCKVINHSPICSCTPPLTGDPFVRCYKQQSEILYSLVFKQYLTLLFLKQYQSYKISLEILVNLLLVDHSRNVEKIQIIWQFVLVFQTIMAHLPTANQNVQ